MKLVLLVEGILANFPPIYFRRSVTSCDYDLYGIFF